MKKKLSSIFVMMTLIFSMSFPAEAVYPVRDSENILQAAKNYAEAVNQVTQATQTVFNTAKQVENMLFQIAKLPQSFIEKQIGMIDAAYNKVVGKIQQAEGNFIKDITPRTTETDIVLNALQKMGKDTPLLEIGIKVEEGKAEQDEILMNAIKKSQETLVEINKTMEDARTNIAELTKKAGEKEIGENQLLQIQNLIQVNQTTIDSCRAQRDIVMAQIDLMKMTSDINKRKIETEGVKANDRANKESLEKIAAAASSTENKTPYNTKFSVPADETAWW